MQNYSTSEPDTKPSHHDNWADDLTGAMSLYFFLCGFVALAADTLHAIKCGQFTVISPYSLPVMKWMFLVGALGSLCAYLGYPRQLKWRIVAVLLNIAFAVGAASAWILLM